MKFVISYIALSVGFCRLFGQEITVMGKVTDELRIPVASVHIVVDGQLGEAISDNSGYYRLTLSRTVKLGDHIVIRIEDKRYELFTLGVDATTSIHDITVVHKGQKLKSTKDSAATNRSTGDIVMQNPVFNGPTQVGNGNTQNIQNPGVAFVVLSDSLRIRVMVALAELKKNYPKAKSIVVKFENGNSRYEFAKSLGQLLQEASLGSYFDSGTSGYDAEHSFDIRCDPSDTIYVKDFMNAISPMLRTTYHFQEFIVGMPIINIHINGTPTFNSDGSCVIE
jgi:hypothetical protein